MHPWWLWRTRLCTDTGSGQWVLVHHSLYSPGNLGTEKPSEPVSGHGAYHPYGQPMLLQGAQRVFIVWRPGRNAKENEAEHTPG